jgi:hypothetical protein
MASVSARPMWRTQPVVAGALAGIAGGLVFGALMVAMMPPMMGMIGSLLGVPSLGWGVHLLFSAIIGAVFGAVVGDRAAGWAPAIALGAAYGVVWWILGPLLIMPIWLGMGPMVSHAFDGSNIVSLMGHLVYGVATGAAYRWLRFW